MEEKWEKGGGEGRVGKEENEEKKEQEKQRVEKENSPEKHCHVTDENTYPMYFQKLNNNNYYYYYYLRGIFHCFSSWARKSDYSSGKLWRPDMKRRVQRHSVGGFEGGS